MKKIMACALVFLMIFGTCATSYAFDLSNVKSFINEATTKVNAVVETVKSEGAEAAYNQVKGELSAAGYAEEIGKLESVATQVKDWYDANSEVVEAVKEAYKPVVDAKVEEAKDWLESKDVDVDSLVERVKELSEKDAKEIFAALGKIKDEAELEVKKLGHKHYEAKNNSKYVAIGGNTVLGVGINSNDNYTKLVAKELGISGVDVLSAIEGNEADIKAADLITYQPDVADVVSKVLETPNWDKYFDTELVEKVWVQAKAVYNANWNEQLPKVEAYVAEVKAAVLAEVESKFPVEYKEAVEDAIDEAVEFCMPYVEYALNYAQENKGVVVDFVANKGTVIDYAEKVAYAVVSYAIETYKEIEAIQAINPEATLLVVGMYNPFKGFEVKSVDAGKYFEYAIGATNVYYAALAAVKDFAFVDVSDAATDGIEEFSFEVLDELSANEDGHKTIANEIVDALTCDLEYEKVDKYEHTATCVLCGAETEEDHVYGGDKVCDFCGYKKSTTSGLTGGSVVVSSYKVTFETNGGSKVNAVSVKKDALLEKPADPTKEGFTFGGWYTDEALTAKYDFATPVTKSFTLYAKWLSEKVTKFTDLDPNAWYYGYVTSIIEKGLMNGVSETEFAPNANLTRAMFVTVLYRVEGTPAVAEVENKFTDVAADQYYTDAVKWATANGIVTGVTETEFAPDASVTREQMAAMLARYVDYKKIAVADGEVAYADDAEISDYAKDAVKVAANLKILIGNTDGTFAPKKNATRAEVATLFVRLLGALEK